MKIQGLTFILFLLICETVCGQVIVDTAFSYKVYYPIFKENKPKVFIDGFHNNLHQKTTGFKPLSNLLQSFGFEVMPLNKSLDNEEVLANCDILVIANPIHQNNRGRWFNPTYNTFTKNEIQTINKWVKSGGRLLLIADHMPFAGAVNELSSSFGINYVNGFTGISENIWPPNKFKINVGENSNYLNYFTVDSIATFTGSALKFSSVNHSLLSFNQQDSIYITDTAWVFNEKTRRIIADGYSQGGITTYGDGIIAAFGEAAMFTAQIAGKSKVGFNSSYAKDNVHFILNIFLSLLKSPEVFDKDYLSNCDKQSICEQYYLMDKFFSENRMADIASIFRDDGYEIGQNFKLQGKDAITNYWLALQDRGIKWEHNILELEVFGNTAFQTGTSKLEYTTGNKGEATISFVNYTIIWKKNEKGIWQIYIDHYTKTGH